MNTNKFISPIYTKLCIRLFSKSLLILFSPSLLILFGCAESMDNWKNENAEKILLAAPSVASTAVKQNEFEKTLQKFLAIPSDNELKEYIHPQLGFYVNHKPGAISIVEHFRTLEEVYEQLPHLEPYFKKFNGKNPKKEEMPNFDCEVFSKEGTFYQITSSFKEIEKGIETNEKITDKVHSQEEKQLAKTTDKKISHVVVLTDDYLEIGFTNMDGKWYMLWFNLAKFDCSA